MTASPANATPSSPASVSVSDDNIDTSSLQRAEGQDDKKKGDDCGDDPRCTPIKWCEGKVIHGKTDGNAIVEGGQPKPECLKVPTAEIDDKDCCKAPPGGTILIKIHNPNGVAVPVQVTIKHGGRDHTKGGWAKPGSSTVKLKKLKNGQYDVTVHLFDCVFGHKTVKIKCDEVTASVSPHTSLSSSPSTAASPSESTSAPGGSGGSDTGDDRLALTGSKTSTLWYGGGLLLLIGGGLLAGSLLYRRRRTVFTSE
jgi:hypothetical protein